MKNPWRIHSRALFHQAWRKPTSANHKNLSASSAARLCPRTKTVGLVKLDAMHWFSVAFLKSYWAYWHWAPMWFHMFPHGLSNSSDMLCVCNRKISFAMLCCLHGFARHSSKVWWSHRNVLKWLPLSAVCETVWTCLNWVVDWIREKEMAGTTHFTKGLDAGASVAWEAARVA